MKNVVFTLLLLAAFSSVHSQNIGIGTNAPNASALLHLNSTNKGVLFPQVSIDSLKDVTSIPAPVNGLIVYNTTEPGVRNDMQRGYYYYSTIANSWVKIADNFNDNVWRTAGTLGIQLRDKADGVEIMDDFLGSAVNYSPKVKILKILDSVLINSKNNMNVLTLTAVNRKTLAGWENRQKATILFENAYVLANGTTSATQSSVAISAYTESTSTTASNSTNGLAFYTFASPQNTAVADTPTLAMFYHNVGIGAYPTDIKNVTEGRLQITGFSNGDQLSLRHPSSINLKWGIYVSSIDSSLNFYSNGSLRANIDRVTGVYSALSDRRLKKDVNALPPVLNNIMKLNSYTYHYLDGQPNDRKAIGFMAQDVEPYFPELVFHTRDRETNEPFLMMNYSSFGVIAIKAIQEQQKIIESQAERITKLEAAIEKINAAIMQK